MTKNTNKKTKGAPKVADCRVFHISRFKVRERAIREENTLNA
jgi:hypothetical protein